MTKLECTATNCFYNTDKCCCKGDIMVEGREAKTAQATCCGSFKEKKGDGARNAVNSPRKDIEVGCQASHCLYNKDCKCEAEQIGIMGQNACRSQETECATFVCK